MNCVYYLALYSRYDVIEGSLFVINKNQYLTLEEGHSITTIAYRNQPDKYKIPVDSFEIIIYQVLGTLKIEITSEGEVEPVIYN